MELNPKGQCPVCKVKPLIYKRKGYKYCSRCGRQFDLDTGQFQSSSMWDDPATKHVVDLNAPEIKRAAANIGSITFHLGPEPSVSFSDDSMKKLYEKVIELSDKQKEAKGRRRSKKAE